MYDTMSQGDFGPDMLFEKLETTFFEVGKSFFKNSKITYICFTKTNEFNHFHVPCLVGTSMGHLGTEI